MTGVLMTVLEVVLSPPFIKAVGIGTWQRLGFLVGVPAIAAVPAVKLLSWNYPSLFGVSVIANTLALCALGAVSEATEFVHDNALFMLFCAIMSMGSFFAHSRRKLRHSPSCCSFPPSITLSKHAWHIERCKQSPG